MLRAIALFALIAGGEARVPGRVRPDVPCVDSIVARHARAVNVPVRVALAVMRVESQCDHEALSTAGARGPMQVMPFWTRTNLAWKCGGTDLHDPEIGACYGTRILRHYVAKHRTWDRALARYSGGSPGYAQKVRLEVKRLPVVPQALPVARSWPTVSPGWLLAMFLLWGAIRTGTPWRRTSVDDLHVLLWWLTWPVWVIRFGLRRP